LFRADPSQEHRRRLVVRALRDEPGGRGGDSIAERASWKAALAQAGIGYVHERTLGNPPENRGLFQSPATVDEGQRVYRAHLDNGSREALERLVNRARVERVAVLCVERAPSACHRAVITDAALELDDSIEVIQVV
jgi:hypothetical protein